MYRILVMFLGFSLSFQLTAQVGINILNPDTSAILHLESQDRGFLPPRMSTSQRDSIFSPKPGLLIYNLEDSVIQYYTGRCWLPTWQRDCDECVFDFFANKSTGVIDRIISNTDTTLLWIDQSNGNANISLYTIGNYPDGMTIRFDSSLLSGQDTVQLIVEADIFTPPGTYPVVIQAACEGSIKSIVVAVTIEPCIEVDITSPQLNYNLQVAANLPTNTPICVVVRIPQGLELTNDASNPVFDVGNLDPLSKVGILNEGFLLALGGDGGVGAGLQGQTGEGSDGTDALNLTTHTHLINTGKIFGGGGGGGSVGFIATIPIPQPVGNFNIGIGAGGGGGARDGIGGNLGTGFGFYEPGQTATSGIVAQPGNGGVLTAPISFTVTIAQFTITPSVFGGDGGAYGVDGAEGSLTFNLDVTINIPFVGNVSIFNQNFPDPPLSVFPAGGTAGFSVRKNGNTLIGLADGYYLTNNYKGNVGN